MPGNIFLCETWSRLVFVCMFINCYYIFSDSRFEYEKEQRHMNKDTATFSLQLEDAARRLQDVKKRIELLRGYL